MVFSGGRFQDFTSKIKADSFAERMSNLGYKIKRKTSKPFGSKVYSVGWSKKRR